MEKLKIELEKKLKDFFINSGFTKAVLGSSGGIDSAVVQTIAVNTLGADNVVALIMPSSFSSRSSVEDAVALSKNLGNSYQIVNISSLYHTYLEVLKNDVYGETHFDITEENLQARIRANLLMAFSNKKQHLLLNTSNKSELSVGYGTLYGDLCGAVSVIGSLYKTQVYELARHLNKNSLIPENIINKEPSAELRHGQKDSDSLPPYSLLDPILHKLIDEGLSPEQVASGGVNIELVNKIAQLIKRSEFKKMQIPPVL